jgi:ribulose-5-phosphate 4-epimerase/fuculose-1-phosphate aldolase
MYITRTGLILGFHGTDQSIVDDVLNGKGDLKERDNVYDWLGHGIYFWDNSPSRAMDWAIELSKRKGSKIKKPAVIGAAYAQTLFGNTVK